MSDLPGEPAAAPLSREALEAELDRERRRAREIDHRAKNTLQLAGGLALLMAKRGAAPETQRALKSLHHRISTVAAVHRGFMDEQRPDRFDLTAFLRDQLAALARTAPSGAELQLDLEPVDIAPASAAPLALISGELVGNALAHAGPAAQVLVRLRREGEGFQLTVEDRGPGLAQADADSGFGLTMVRLMTQQLRGQLALEEAQPGLRAVVTVA